MKGLWMNQNYEVVYVIDDWLVDEAIDTRVSHRMVRSASSRSIRMNFLVRL